MTARALPQALVSWAIPAPADAPETKGTVCYFKPTELHWTVYPTMVVLTIEGPATRRQHRYGAVNLVVEGRWLDDLPDWVQIPAASIARARALLTGLGAS